MSESKSDSVTSHENSVQPEQKTESKADKVAYETYSKVLAEAKKLKEKVKSYEDEQSKKQEESLKAQNEWKTLAEQYKGKLEETNKKLSEQEESIVNGIKYQSFQKHLGGEIVNEKYLNFIPFEKIIINPETKQVDEDSVKMAVSEFAKEHSHLVNFKNGARIPNAAPKAPSFSLDLNSIKTKDDIKKALAVALGKQ